MKVIFLDIDGVMNHISPKVSTPCRQVGDLLVMTDPEKVYALNVLVDRHDFKVVLSSSWRHDPKWRETMRANGFLFEFLDRTAVKTREIGGHNGGSVEDGTYRRSRGAVIRAWLDEHPEVERYAILDDEYDAGFGHPDEVFFKTRTFEGMLPKAFERLEAYLISE